MSIVSDDLFADKVLQLKALKDEIDQDRNEVYQVLGEWLANALDDDDNDELQKIFMAEYGNAKYLRLKRHRELIKLIAKKLEAKAKVIPSSFTPPKNTSDSQENLSFDDNANNRSL